MAWRAGCDIKNMEFNQFHPTCLYYPDDRPFLISEVLRGEGGKLTLPNGERFMQKYDAREELAPRDIVSRAIHHELQTHHFDHVYLDISHLSRDMIQSYFPTIYRFCYQQGIDITRQPIPVVPAAHYTCGGVTTNLHAQTTIPHLYVIGETAYTGLHGANRMASNSLLECLVFAASASEAIQKSLQNDQYITIEIEPMQNINLTHTFDIDRHIAEIRELMWNHVSIVHHTKGLLFSESEIEKAATKINTLFYSNKVTRKSIEYRNLTHTANLIIKSALARQENIGLHYNADLAEISV